MQVNFAAADIDQLTRLDVEQQPLVLRYRGLAIGRGKGDFANAKQRGGRQGGQGSAKCERRHGCSLVGQLRYSLRPLSRNSRVTFDRRPLRSEERRVGKE